MCPGKRPAAKVRIDIERVAFDDLADRTETAVLELADVKMPVGLRVFRPAQKKIARGLHRALALDDPSALLDEARRRRNDRFEYRSKRLLDLQEQRLTIRRHEKPDRAKGADAADANDLDGDIGKRIMFHERAHFGRESGFVIGEGGMRMNLVARGCRGIGSVH